MKHNEDGSITATEEELLNHLHRWMVQENGSPNAARGRAKDRWYRDKGLIADFVWSIFKEGEQ